jgi:hypothetical protein
MDEAILLEIDAPYLPNPRGFAAHSRWLRSASDDTTGYGRVKCPSTPAGVPAP